MKWKSTNKALVDRAHINACSKLQSDHFIILQTRYLSRETLNQSGYATSIWTDTMLAWIINRNHRVKYEACNYTITHDWFYRTAACIIAAAFVQMWLSKNVFIHRSKGRWLQNSNRYNYSVCHWFYVTLILSTFLSFFLKIMRWWLQNCNQYNYSFVTRFMSL